MICACAHAHTGCHAHIAASILYLTRPYTHTRTYIVRGRELPRPLCGIHPVPNKTHIFLVPVTVADPGGIPGSHGSPLSAQLSSRSVCTMRNFSVDGSPYLMNSKIILTIAHLQVFLNEFWSIACPRAQQTTQNTPFSIASGRGHHKKWAWHQKFARFARVLCTQNPPS